MIRSHTTCIAQEIPRSHTTCNVHVVYLSSTIPRSTPPLNPHIQICREHGVAGGRAT